MIHLTNLEIEQAIAKYSPKNGHHEHPDCIRMAIQWLSAQKRIKSKRKHCAMKHIVEKWCGRYVSMTDVIVAAKILGLEGEYPQFHLSARLVKPCVSRLEGIGEAFKHSSYASKAYPNYAYDEKLVTP